MLGSLLKMSVDFVILAAGNGSRMHSSLPKFFQTVAGKPIIRYIIDACHELSHNVIVVTKDNFKLKNKIVLPTYTSNNSTVDNINLNNLYISNNSIVPIKSSKKIFKSLRYSENSNSFNSSDNKNIKTINNRVINYAKTINDDSDKDNYCFLINKIEPYLIKKFQNT